MSEKATSGNDELVQAYNRAVENAVGAFDTGIAQAAGAVRLMSEAAETERDELGKALEQGATLARKRSENLATVLPGIWQGIAIRPGAAAPESGSEARDSIGKLVESETSFYESMTEAWVKYVAGWEQRRGAAAVALMESNARVVDANQRAARGVAEYGQALFNWSMETANTKHARKE